MSEEPQLTIRREIRETQDRLVVGTARVDQIQKQVEDLESTVVELSASYRERAANADRHRRRLPLLATSLLVTPLAVVMLGRGLPSLAVLASLLSILLVLPRVRTSARPLGSTRARPGPLAKRSVAGLDEGVGGFAAAGVVIGVIVAFVGVKLGSVLMVGLVAAVVVGGAARAGITRRWLTRHRLERLGLAASHVTRLAFPRGAIRRWSIPPLVACMWALIIGVVAYTGVQLEDYLLAAVAFGIVGVLAMTWVLGPAGRFLLGPQTVIAVALVCSSATLVFGAVRANTIAPYKPPRGVQAALSDRDPVPPKRTVASARYGLTASGPGATYEQMCGRTSHPGAPAPKSIADAIARRWFSAGANVAGCPMVAQAIDAHPQTYFVPGYRKGTLRSLAVGSRSGVALLFDEPAQFAFSRALDGTLRGATSRLSLHGGDGVVVHTSEGSWILIRRYQPGSAGRYTILRPTLASLWLRASARAGWTWPMPTLSGDQSGRARYVFLRDGSDTPLGSAVCVDSQCELEIGHMKLKSGSQTYLSFKAAQRELAEFSSQ